MPWKNSIVTATRLNSGPHLAEAHDVHVGLRDQPGAQTEAPADEQAEHGGQRDDPETADLDQHEDDPLAVGDQ